ncbi:MAG: hypothetical protein JSS01_17455, partial [Proteobacteria bacterium]|nr:hypothetical protein [Pseudomonadota bacterium]
MTATTPGKRGIAPAYLILIAMLLGIAIGYFVFIEFPDKQSAKSVAGYISIIS